MNNVYVANIDVEDLEDYTIGGYHPTVIGDIFHDGRDKIAHKLGFGGYSTIWLARDQQLQRYVALKILTARQVENDEPRILQLLCSSDSTHPGNRFIPRLLDEFTFDGPNGRHLCLVQEVAACSITVAKEWSSNNMFPVETARSIAVQLFWGLSYLHCRGVCHGDLHMHNFLIYGLHIDHLSPDELYSRYHFDSDPVKRVDGGPPEPHAPPYAVLPMPIKTPANKLVDPIVKISDYGTSFVVATDTPTPELRTPMLYRPPEALFDDHILPFAADIWTFGLNLYEVLGAQVLFETFNWDRDDILAEMVNTLGRPPQRWWDAWVDRGEFFDDNGEWRKGPQMTRLYDPVWRPLHLRLWDMGRGATLESCEWDVEAGEMKALEDLLRGMLTWEPEKRWTAEDVVRSEYMVKWALPAWERQQRRMKEGRGGDRGDDVV